VFTINFTVFTINFTVFTINFTVFTINFTVFTINFIVFTINFRILQTSEQTFWGIFFFISVFKKHNPVSLYSVRFIVSPSIAALSLRKPVDPVTGRFSGKR